MARELKGYAAKRLRGLVPHRYDTKLRGVGPISHSEALQHERNSYAKAGKVHPVDLVGPA